MNNIQHFLLQNEAAIESIPSLDARISQLETGFEQADYNELFGGPRDLGGGALETWSVVDHDELFPTGDEVLFDQDHWDELFAAGGSTEQTWDRADHAELFETPNI